MAARVKFAVKGQRMSASVTLPRDVLPTLVPLLRSYPHVTWSANANSSIGGEGLLLSDSAPASGSDTPLISLFVSRIGGGAELEVLSARVPTTDAKPRANDTAPSAAPALSDKEMHALAETLLVAERLPAISEGRRAGGPLPRPGGSGLLGELFRDLQPPRPDGSQQQVPGGGGGGGAPGGGAPGGRGGGPVERLEALGVKVLMPKAGSEGGAEAGGGEVGGGETDWDLLAGSEAVRSALEESLLLPLLHPDVYEEVMRGTRRAAVAPHAKAILFTGPPGCGKTSTARILAAKLNRPFVALPLESLVSKFYGEAEQVVRGLRVAPHPPQPQHRTHTCARRNAYARALRGPRCRAALLNTPSHSVEAQSSALGSRLAPLCTAPRHRLRRLRRDGRERHLPRRDRRARRQPRRRRWHARGDAPLALRPAAPPRRLRRQQVDGGLPSD